MSLFFEIIILVIAILGLIIAGIMSVFGLSGMWVVLGCAVLSTVGPAGSPGWRVVLLLALISLLIEGIECFSGWWGVKRQGGSAAAGWAAMGGGLLGGIVGGMVPPGLVWALVGMLAGSFIAVYWVEHNRLGHSGHAVRVATGALLARVGMLFVKVVASLGMGGFVVWVLLVELFRG